MAMPALLDMTLCGEIAAGMEKFHKVLLDEDIEYTIALSPEDMDADLDFFITDQSCTVIFQDETSEPGAQVYFTPDYSGPHFFFVRGVEGQTAYTITVKENAS